MRNEAAAHPAAPHVGFTVAMAVVLAVVGVLAYNRLAAGLSDDLNRSLRQRAQDLVVPVSQPSSSLAELAGAGFIERGESFAELLTPNGGVLQATETLNKQPLLSPAEAPPQSSWTARQHLG